MKSDENLELLDREIQTLNEYFKEINISPYLERPDEFYEQQGINLKQLRRILFNNPLEHYTNYLIFVGYEFFVMQSDRIMSTSAILSNNVYNARLLLFLRNTPSNKIEISVCSNLNIKHTTHEKSIINAIKNELEHSFEKLLNVGTEINNKISNDQLLDYIESKEKIAFRKGAPYSKHKVAAFAELLIFLAYYKENEFIDPYKQAETSNANCELIHDYLVFWRLIDKKEKIKNQKKKSFVTPHNYIRQLIINLRKQRDNR